jgi:hypothetical protein
MLGRHLPTERESSGSTVEDIYVKKLIYSFVQWLLNNLPEIAPTASTSSNPVETTEIVQQFPDYSNIFLSDGVFKQAKHIDNPLQDEEQAFQEVREFWKCKIENSWVFVEEDNNSTFRSPLDYWEHQRSRWPILSRIATHILMIPASSAETERLWSLAGNILTERRSRLSSEMLNMLIFCARNMYLLSQLPK